MELAKVNLKILAERVNDRLRTGHDESYLGKVRKGKKGSSSLQDVVRQEESKILFEAAAAKANA